MQLGQAEALCVFNEHHACVRNIHSNLKQSRTDQRACLDASKALHNLLLFGCRNSPVEQLAPKWMQTFLPEFILRRSCFHIEFFGFIDQRIDHVKLTPRFQLCSQKGKYITKARLVTDSRNYLSSVSWHLIDG